MIIIFPLALLLSFVILLDIRYTVFGARGVGTWDKFITKTCNKDIKSLQRKAFNKSSLRMKRRSDDINKDLCLLSFIFCWSHNFYSINGFCCCLQTEPKLLKSFNVLKLRNWDINSRNHRRSPENILFVYLKFKSGIQEVKFIFSFLFFASPFNMSSPCFQRSKMLQKKFLWMNGAFIEWTLFTLHHFESI